MAAERDFEQSMLVDEQAYRRLLAAELKRAQRYDEPLSVLLVELDRLAALRERHPAEVVERLRVEVAQCIARSLRNTDAVAPWPGDEYAVLLPKTHLSGALTVAERVWRDIGQLAAGPQGTLRVTASIGVCVYPSRSILSAEQLIESARVALDRARSEGRNRVRLYQAG